MKLNRTGSNWNELERNKINENWDIIEGGYNDVVGQITDEVVGHLIDSAKLIWKEPVGTEADLPKDAEVGETRMVRESVDGVSHVYRYNGTEWELIQEIDATLVNEVDRRLTAQLAQKATQVDIKRVNQKDFYSFHQRNSSDSFSNRYSILGDRHFIFDVGLSETESVSHEFKKNPLDDFIKWTTSKLNYHSEEGFEQVHRENFVFDNVANGSLYGIGNNFYARDVGTTITHQFEGHSISFNHYVDDRGGVWECSIDGEVVNTISTHINAVPAEDVYTTVAKRLIAEGLENTSHTLVMKFIGDDPNNPPSSGAETSRGWIRFNDESSADPELNRYSFEYKKMADEGIDSVEILFNSNKEFAFRIKKQGATYSDEWVPEHNAMGTAFVGNTGFQELYIDGLKINQSEPVTDNPFKEAKIIQKIECVNPHDTERLGTLLLTATINHKGVSLSSKVLWEKNTLITAGYVNMLTLNRDFASEMISSYGGKYNLNIIDGSIEDVIEPAPYSFIALNPTKFPNFYLYMQSFSPTQTLRLYNEGRRGNEEGEGLYFLQHRDDKLQKLYPRVYTNYVAIAGETYEFEGHYGFGKHPRVADLLS